MWFSSRFLLIFFPQAIPVTYGLSMPHHWTGTSSSVSINFKKNNATRTVSHLSDKNTGPAAKRYNKPFLFYFLTDFKVLIFYWLRFGYFSRLISIICVNEKSLKNPKFKSLKNPKPFRKPDEHSLNGGDYNVRYRYSVSSTATWDGWHTEDKIAPHELETESGTFTILKAVNVLRPLVEISGSHFNFS